MLFGAVIVLLVALVIWLDDNAIRAIVGLVSAFLFQWLFKLLFSGADVKLDQGKVSGKGDV